MSKRPVKSKSHKAKLRHVYDKEWAQVALSLTFLLLAYVGASLSIDSGSLMAYVATVLFMVLTVHYAIQAVRKRSA